METAAHVNRLEAKAFPPLFSTPLVGTARRNNKDKTFMVPF